jgi:chromosome segregation ATPase
MKCYDIGTRPSESRLFRPTDSFEDLSTMTMSLQEALSREKMLEDKLIKVKSMISKNIGRSQTDLMRLFEDVKQELINLYEERESIVANSKDDGAVEKLGTENHNLKKQIQELERLLQDHNQAISLLQRKTQADAVELMTLRKACQMQKDDMQSLEHKLQQGLDDRVEAEHATAEVIRECEQKMLERENEFEKEKGPMKERLHEALSHESDNLNRIKSLESDEDYHRAEVDRVLGKEREIMESNQQLQYRVECLETELAQAHDVSLEKVLQSSLLVLKCQVLKSMIIFTILGD